MDSAIASDPTFDRVWRSMLSTLAMLVLLLSVALFIRRLSGALTTPLDGVRFAVAAGFGVVASWIYRRAWLVGRGKLENWTNVVWLGIPSICLVLAIAAMTASPTPLWSRLLGWCAIVVSEVIWWLPRFTTSRQSTDALPVTSQTDSFQSPVLVESFGQLEEEPSLAPDVSQQLTRSRGSDDVDTMYGLVRTTIERGELTQQIHVAFCPPFEARPTLRAFVVEGIDAMVQVAQLESFGVRLEVRLPSHSPTTEDVLIEFDAQCSPLHPPRSDDTTSAA